MAAIKNIIFDYGNVIFMLDFVRQQNAWKEIGILEPEKFYGHKVQDNLFDAFERGDACAAEFRDHVRKKTGNNELTDMQIDYAWNSLLIGIPPGNIELLLKLKSKYRTFLLSNINAIHYDYIMNYLKNDFGFEVFYGLFCITVQRHVDLLDRIFLELADLFLA